MSALSKQRIIIEAIEADQQRYDTVGDWLYDAAGNLVIRVTGPNVFDRETFLIALHEMVEAMLCRDRGISQEAIDAFDMAFDGHGEPGDDPAAPYRQEHRFAMLIEHQMAHELGMTGYGTVE